MTQETEVNAMIHPGDPVLTAAQDRAIKHFRSAHRYRRRSLEEAWTCGRALSEVRDLMDHGGWENWLESVRIARSTGHRWIRLSEQYEMSQLGTFGSVDAALKAMPPARPEPEKPLEPENDESAETEEHPVENSRLTRDTVDPHPVADEGSEEPNNAPAASEPDATHHRNGDDLDSDDFRILLGEYPRQVGTDSPQVPVDQLPQVQGQDLSPGPEKEVADGGGTSPLPSRLDDAHQEILQLRRKLRKSQEKLQKARDQKTELQQEIDRLRRRLEQGPQTGSIEGARFPGRIHSN